MLGKLASFIIRFKWLVLLAWLLLTVAGGYGASKATARLSYDFSLPKQPAYETNKVITNLSGSGGSNAPILLVVGNNQTVISSASGQVVASAAQKALPGARVVSYADNPTLASTDNKLGIVMVYPVPEAGPEPYGKSLPMLTKLAASQSAALKLPVAVTGEDALAEAGGSGGSDILAETLFGAIGALIVLILVFGSFLAITPMITAAASILTTFLVLWGLTEFTQVSFIVEFLLALIGLGVAIDYSLLIVTRWREERGKGLDNNAAITAALHSAGRSVFFSGLTVAISLAALIALPVPFLRSVGYAGLLIPIISVISSLTLLPALLLTVGPKLEFPHRRSSQPVSKLWRGIGKRVVRHRWLSAAGATIILLALMAPLITLRLGQPTTDALASVGGPAAQAITLVNNSSIGAGVAAPMEILTHNPAAVINTLDNTAGVSNVLRGPDWNYGGGSVIDAWAKLDPSTKDGAKIYAQARSSLENADSMVGGIPAQNTDFIKAVYGNAWKIGLIIAAVTFLLLARALRSIVLPLKALVLNVLSLGAAYGITVLIWQHGIGTQLLFNQSASGAITVWIPVSVFSFLFGLSMDYEVFLLSRIREEYKRTGSTDQATINGVAKTGRLVSSAALILFLAFISLSRAPGTDVKILATALALGIIIDATIVRGILAPALVAGFGRANWWWPFGQHNA